jgi:hypothetical protein
MRITTCLAVVLVGLCYATSAPLTAQQPQNTTSASPTYTWHGELVSFEAGTRTVTVKSRALFASEASKVLAGLKSGDKILVHWSGFDRSADAIRTVMKYDTARMAKEQFLLPAELAATDLQNDYLTFKLRVPESSVAAVQKIKPGEWITFTTRHRPASDADAVVTVRHYNDVPGTNNNT